MKTSRLTQYLSVCVARRAMFLLCVNLIAVASVSPAVADDSSDSSDTRRIEFDIPAQAVPAALGEFARQAGVQLFFISDGFEHVQANALVGTYSAQEGLELVLAGTGLEATYSESSGIKVRRVGELSQSRAQLSLPFAPAQGSESRPVAIEPESSRAVQHDSGDSASLADIRKSIEEIVVTGTSIRGVIPASTPLAIYDAVDIRNTGAVTVEEFVRLLPQNNATLTEVGMGMSSRETNANGISSIDLRGLGVGTTLVLLNGRRLAPASHGRTVDLSMIPLHAVERVEVLTDGASAIYGADAIGGVINFVLKQKQDGAETVLGFGSADGGNELFTLDQSFGFDWTGGTALLALSYLDRNPLHASDREFARSTSPSTLIPSDTRSGVLLTVTQDLPRKLRLAGDILHSAREPRALQLQTLANRVLEHANDHEQTVANLEVSRPIGESTNGTVLVTFAESDTDETTVRTALSGGASGTAFRAEDTTTLDITAKLDGELARLRAGSVLYALGGGYTEDEFRRYNDATGIGGGITDSTLDRNTRYAFAELLLPLVSPEQHVSAIRRFEVSLAARYTDYSDFGDNTSPKVGVVWSPVAPLTIRATFGESYKAPFLVQLNTNSSSNTYGLFPATSLGFPDIWTPDGSAVVLFAQGPGNPFLGPEQAETYTYGFDFEQNGFSVSATYFNIDYTDRIAEPDPSGGFTVLGDPQNFPELLNVEPTLEQVTQLLSTSIPFVNRTGVDIFDPVAVHAATTVFFDNRIQNLSITELDGLDIAIEYSPELFDGRLSLGIQAAHIFDYLERTTPTSSPITRIDTVLFPADFKARGHIGFEGDRWSVRLNVNYVDSYDNPFAEPDQSVDDWTTADVLLSFALSGSEDEGLFAGTRVAMVVQNVFDSRPPFIAMGTTVNTSILEPIGFDPANASPVGRFISVQLSKEW